MGKRLESTIRGLYDFMKYTYKLNKLESSFFLIEICALSAAVISIWNDWLSIEEMHPGIILYLVLSVAIIFYNLIKIILDLRTLLHYETSKKEEVDYDYNRLTLSHKETKNGFIKLVLPDEITDKNECIVYSDKLNSLLNLKDWRIQIDKNYSQTENFIKNHKKTLMPFLTKNLIESILKGRDFYNEKKLCLSHDIDINSNTINCHIGTYFDSYLTNESTGKVLKNKTKDIVKYDARTISVIDSNIYSCKMVLQDITTSENNNHLGSSSLAYTKDRYFVWWIQNGNSQFSQDLLAPTGSGSCDHDDLSPDFSFTKTIINNMQRELMEESNLKGVLKNKNDITGTLLLGFYRWIRRGGLPQFIGITRLNVNLTDLSPNSEEVYLDTENKGKNNIYVDDLNGLKKLISKIRYESHKKNSVPMYMATLFIENMIKKNPEDLISFLEIKD